jgi:hypothetical protein
VAAVTADTDKQLAWEARHRIRAGIAAAIAAVALLAFFVLQEVLNSRIPKPSGLESLGRAARPGEIDALPSLQIPLFEFLEDNRPLVLGIGVAGFLGYLGLAWAVGFLGVAARARQPTLRKFALYLPIVGGALLGIGSLLLQIGRLSLASGFMSGNQTVAQARVASSGLLIFAQVLLSIGTIALAAGLVLISLNAMRAGLLTRLFGYIGVIAGAMLLLLPLPIVQVFWIGGLAVLFLGRWPGGDPPAWRTGQAEPWPTNRPAAPPARPAAQPQPATAPAGPRRKRKKRH